MSEIDDSAMERRFQRNTFAVIIVALAAGWFWSGWRMALGVLLGGALSLFNKRWLQGSVRAILSHAVIMQDGRVPPFAASKFILRYLVIAIVIGVAIWSGKFHALGIGIGFAAFVGGVMIEAGYLLYLSLSSDNLIDSSENTTKE
jgi:hypothetical protein